MSHETRSRAYSSHLMRGFTDPARRPRMIVLSGAVAICLIAGFMLVIGATSTRWFCAQVCHKVQDDSIIAYEKSSHSEISCLACHEKVNADPVTFMFAKAKALGELAQTVTRTYKLPLNAGSVLSLNKHEMGFAQCTQCHSANRKVTPSPGIIIDHAVHEKSGVTCTTCHNRVAHNETGWKLTLTGVDGKPNRKHPDFMKMAACYRCHDLEGKKTAPGDCSLCHPVGFQLKPANHLVPGFYQRYGDSKGHAKLGAEDASAVVEASKEAELLVEEGVAKNLAEPVSYCGTCHIRAKFCDGCHGVPMPHPAGFSKDHGAAGKKSPAACANCHAKSKATAGGTDFCNACHHKAGDPTKAWLPQHFIVVRNTDPNACFDCHNPTFCAECHVRGLGR
jgi:nitrate/TMAO reductase-like tetraheme cytochrome c subunit